FEQSRSPKERIQRTSPPKKHHRALGTWVRVFFRSNTRSVEQGSDLANHVRCQAVGALELLNDLFAQVIERAFGLPLMEALLAGDERLQVVVAQSTQAPE